MAKLNPLMHKGRVAFNRTTIRHFSLGSPTSPVSERILVVEGELPLREVLSTTLVTAGYECQQARSGYEALQLLSCGQRFDLMIFDFKMAGMGGDELLKYTRDRCQDMPVVIIAAVEDISLALAAFRNTPYDYLPKPFERHQLLSTVQRALENRRLKLENQAYQTNLESALDERTQQLRRAMSDLERSYDITLEALGNALDLKGAETEGHSKRVTAFTIAVARAMDLGADKINIIARGAFLHDIGKMAIPDAILRKPAALTPDEVAIMRQHCYRGYEMVRRIPFLVEAAEIVYSHQERYDGTGYPRGLRGEQIHLGARIFAVADTLDAITSGRPIALSDRGVSH